MHDKVGYAIAQIFLAKNLSETQFLKFPKIWDRVACTLGSAGISYRRFVGERYPVRFGMNETQNLAAFSFAVWGGRLDLAIGVANETALEIDLINHEC
jgi:hypothetical protein